MKEYPKAMNPTGGAWILEENHTWNVPAEGHRVSFDVEYTRFPFAALRSIKGLAMGMDGTVYGVRTMGKPREDGYVHRGQISVDGKRVTAFTGSRMFQRPDGSLIDVACFLF